MADPADVAHLLRRTEFVARPNRLSALTPMTIADAVENILDFSSNTAVPPASLTTYTTESYDQYVAACGWWMTQMRDQPRPFQEKMVLFWHGHFTSSWSDVDQGYQMMLQQQLYRTNALGNFRNLTQAMSLEPAMLVYLSNASNVKGSPNQNFARELMELFTLGIGNYTEADVDAAARAWTGHNYDYTNRVYWYRDTKHDHTQKTFFGTTKDWNGPDIVNEILRDNAGKKLIAARYITRKLWEHLAYIGPSDTLVNTLADVFLANDFELKPLLRAILNDPEFYSTAAKQGIVQPPIDWVVRLSYYTGIPFDGDGGFGVSWALESTGQQIYRPPNVAGWKPNAYWLNAGALSGRSDFAETASWRLDGSAIWTTLAGFSRTTQKTNAALAVSDFFGLTPLSDPSRIALENAFAAETNSYYRVRNTLLMTMLTPEFHMA